MKDESSTYDPVRDFGERLARNRAAFADLNQLEHALVEALRLVHHLRDLHRVV